MADLGDLSPEEIKAIQDHRAATRPKRKGTMRGTDPDSGAEFEIELTPEEAEKLVGRHAKLFASDDKTGDDKDGGKPPAQLKDYFNRGTRKSG
jgi:hypothetical protein